MPNHPLIINNLLISRGFVKSLTSSLDIPSTIAIFPTQLNRTLSFPVGAPPLYSSPPANAQGMEPKSPIIYLIFTKAIIKYKELNTECLILSFLLFLGLICPKEKSIKS